MKKLDTLVGLITWRTAEVTLLKRPWKSLCMQWSIEDCMASLNDFMEYSILSEDFFFLGFHVCTDQIHYSSNRIITKQKWKLNLNVFPDHLNKTKSSSLGILGFFFFLICLFVCFLFLTCDYCPFVISNIHFRSSSSMYIVVCFDSKLPGCETKWELYGVTFLGLASGWESSYKPLFIT